MEDVEAKKNVSPRESSFAFHCSFQDEWGTNDGTEATAVITYDREYFGTSSQDIHAGMDIETGVYTAGYAGVYEVTWSLAAYDDHDHANPHIYLYKNNLQMPESVLWGSSVSPVNDHGSRTMFLRLDQFDQIYLNCENCFIVHNINFCIALVQPDPFGGV